MSSLPLRHLPPREPLSSRDFDPESDRLAPGFRADVDFLELPGCSSGALRVGYAGSEKAIRAAQRLRFEVFNEELNEGLLASLATGRDEDPFDAQMTHLLIVERGTDRVVGTYRLQTKATAAAHRGLYAAEEYDLATLEPWLKNGVECGRACVAADHRSFAAVLLLWKGIVAFSCLTGCPWLFGCCSVTTLDPNDGWRAMKTLREAKCLHPTLMAPATPAFSCGEPSRENAPEIGGAIELPKLFSAYMRLGALVVSEPALDRAFGTVDFLVMLDARSIRLAALSPEAVMRKVRPGGGAAFALAGTSE
jgi:putative hemolysin